MRTLSRKAFRFFHKFTDEPWGGGIASDTERQRIQVWEDSLWGLAVSLDAEILALSYLEPKRHIPYITDLDDEEARTFGSVLARLTHVLPGR